ncbi:hypothetical protein MUK42_25444 [Musa troglodytarum]|uniref:Uncharacterized protein n=1 Tax=Musa troglodytarum TaxID=320322 RepID=A0A9E7FKC4_9LILI|nr:hypothetical protein MUK42_25444 [Musa troglodytarum]
MSNWGIPSGVGRRGLVASIYRALMSRGTLDTCQLSMIQGPNGQAQRSRHALCRSSATALLLEQVIQHDAESILSNHRTEKKLLRQINFDIRKVYKEEDH